jgi:hypothetical protein
VIFLFLLPLMTWFFADGPGPIGGHSYKLLWGLQQPPSQGPAPAHKYLSKFPWSG